jgi:hypothetical protein
MTFERRDFLKAGPIAMAASLAAPAFAFRDDSASKSKGELEGGSSWLRLEGQLKAGHMVMEARAFEEGHDRAVIIRSKLTTTGDSIDLYSGMFSYDNERIIFAVFHDTGHSTSTLLSDTDDPKIGRLLAWNDSSAPGVFEINKDKFLESGNLNDSIRDAKGAVVDMLGKRKPPAFTWQELEEVFGDDPALLQFMRGNKSRHHPAKGELQAFGCHMVSSVPGSTLALAWQAK